MARCLRARGTLRLRVPGSRGDLQRPFHQEFAGDEQLQSILARLGKFEASEVEHAFHDLPEIAELEDPFRVEHCGTLVVNVDEFQSDRQRTLPSFRLF